MGNVPRAADNDQVSGELQVAYELELTRVADTRSRISGLWLGTRQTWRKSRLGLLCVWRRVMIRSCA